MGGMGGMGGDGGMGGMGGMGGNVNVNRNVNVHVRGVRPWVNRTWYGTAIAGVTLGTIIAVSRGACASGGQPVLVLDQLG